MTALPSTWSQSEITEEILMKFDLWGLHQKLLRYIILVYIDQVKRYFTLKWNRTLSTFLSTASDKLLYAWHKIYNWATHFNKLLWYEVFGKRTGKIIYDCIVIHMRDRVRFATVDLYTVCNIWTLNILHHRRVAVSPHWRTLFHTYFYTSHYLFPLNMRHIGVIDCVLELAVF